MARIGARATLIPGLALAATALVLFSRMPVHVSYIADVLLPMLVFGLGAGLAFAPGVALAMADAGPTDSGIASGLANVTLQLGAALGLAVLASVSTIRTQHLHDGGSTTRAALTGGYHVAFLIGAGCLVAGVILASTLLRTKTTRHTPAPEPGAPETLEVPAVS
jgi:MFS family permease